MLRMTGALLLSAAIALLTGPKLIAYLKKLHFGQTIYELGPAHQKKQGTPVMGGLMMAAGIIVASLVFHPAKWDGLQDFIIPLLLVSFLFFVPVFSEYLQTGLVPRFPTLLACGFVAVAAIQAFFSGMILETIQYKNRQDFELALIQAERDLQPLLDRDGAGLTTAGAARETSPAI